MGQQNSRDQITLIGAGLAGSLLAIFLAKRGYAVQIFERRPDMRQVDIPAGRSINLALSTRGIHALQQVGLKDEILKKVIPMRGRMIHPVEGALKFQPYSPNPANAINSISRAQLNEVLMTAAEQHGVQIHFNMKCTGMNYKTGELFLQDQTSGQTRTIQPERVIGTDGSASALRTAMLRISRFNFSQQYIEHGYKELTIPPGENGQFQLEKNALHIWPRRSFMLIALPNLDGSFTCTLFLPFEGPNSFETLNNESRVLSFFKTHFPDAVPLLPNLLDDFFHHPTGALVTIRCFPWHVREQTLLLGDAAHAIVPFFGQGMNCAFEDCTVLDGFIEKYAPDWEKVFAEYEAVRKPDTDAIAEMALENFIEMRDRVADDRFFLQKQIELELERRFPGKFVSRYEMVTFTRIPYAEAQRLGKIQAQILQELSESAQNLNQVNWQKAEKLLNQKLETAKSLSPGEIS